MLGELDKLEEKIGEAAETIRILRDQNRELQTRLDQAERERGRFLEERTVLAERISKLVDRVDALRMEL